MRFTEFLYYLGFSVRQYFSFKNRKHLPCKVISIGNLTVGGTGKTPAAIAVAEEAIRRGLSPIILTRGYKGTATGPCFVTRGEGPLLSVKEAGDEPFLMAERLRGAPVVKCRSRYEGGLFALHELRIPESEFGRHLFILDDGFQHRGLSRDMDIVLIDAGEPFGKGTLLPSGRLREPLYSLGRADIIVLTKTGETPEDGSGRLDNLYAEIRKYNQRCHIFRADHAPSACKLINGSEKPIGWLSGKKVFGFCALGCPESFLRTLRFSGADVVGFRYFRDHHAYGFEDISAIKTEAERVRAGWIVTTEKDIIKTRDLDLHGNVAVVSISFSIEEGFYEEVFGRQVG